MASRRMLVWALRYLTCFGRPGPDFCWIDDKLGIAADLRPQHAPALIDARVGAVCNLRKTKGHTSDYLDRHGIHYLHLPVEDCFAPSLDQLVEGVVWVSNEKEAGRRTLLHCKYGVGRSVVLACCAMMSEGWELEAALDLVKSRRWGVVLSPHQQEALIRFRSLLEEHHPIELRAVTSAPRMGNRDWRKVG